MSYKSDRMMQVFNYGFPSRVSSTLILYTNMNWTALTVWLTGLLQLPRVPSQVATRASILGRDLALLVEWGERGCGLRVLVMQGIPDVGRTTSYHINITQWSVIAVRRDMIIDGLIVFFLNYRKHSFDTQMMRYWSFSSR